jgi:hypothetical protein
MRYRARAMDASQQIHELQLDASDRADAERQLREQGLAPLALRRSHLFGLRARAPRFELLLFAQELLALVAAGLGRRAPSGRTVCHGLRLGDLRCTTAPRWLGLQTATAAAP